MQGDIGDLIYLAFIIVPAAYVITRVAAEGWFGAKLNYQRRLLGYMKGDAEHGI